MTEKSLKQSETKLNHSSSSKKTEYIIDSNYLITEKIGSGSFGTIYKGKDIHSDLNVAIKFEKTSNDNSRMLPREIKIMKELQDLPGFPKMISNGKKDNYCYLSMTLLGPNLENLVRKFNNHFSLKSVTMIGYQIIQRLEILHEKNYLHRDIKPENFLIGLGENARTVYIIDFGLSKKYIDENGNHIPYREKKGLVGTARYTSLNSHLGIEQCRRDDLEAVGYLLIYFLKGNLPWQNLQIENKNEKFKKIMEIKKNTTSETLCKGTPDEFASYLNYTKKLQFIEKPDYDYLKGLFVNIMKKNKFEMDCEFDWVNNNKGNIIPKKNNSLGGIDSAKKNNPANKENQEISNNNLSIDEEVKVNQTYETKLRKFVNDYEKDTYKVTHYHMHNTPKNFMTKSSQNFFNLKNSKDFY